jgi:drug/metabolite transporter (DMT)-like permease
MSQNAWFLFLFAMTAAAGNALFAAGQRLSAGIENSLSVVGMSAVVCLILVAIALPLTGGYGDLSRDFLSHWQWIVLSGTGLFLTYLGFNLLYRNFGASAYVYYAVLSILTTSFLVGMIILRERVNVYHVLSGVTAIVAIVLFSIGNRITP